MATRFRALICFLMTSSLVESVLKTSDFRTHTVGGTAVRTYADLRGGHRRGFSVQGPTPLRPSETLAAACSQPEGYEHQGRVLIGIRTRVNGLPSVSSLCRLPKLTRAFQSYQRQTTAWPPPSSRQPSTISRSRLADCRNLWRTDTRVIRSELRRTREQVVLTDEIVPEIFCDECVELTPKLR